VPCDLKADKWGMIHVVTGPNSGGKTRLLQGIAITQMLAQCGMYAAAAEATLSRATGLFVSLVEEARADQKEGRLGTELIRIRNLFERSRPGSLVILDELCSGTNPSEGEEIFRLVISLLHQLEPCVFITTHFLQFAARLEAESEESADLSFLQVALDEDECPTFRFMPGVARTSLAHQTAARLGVTREELLSLVRRNCRAVSGS
jgi:DNA mismatch repair protein MutS2